MHKACQEEGVGLKPLITKVFQKITAKFNFGRHFKIVPFWDTHLQAMPGKTVRSTV
jgi:hypothetical protein